MKPRLLDLFCGAGGAGHGYQIAGWDVTGVDIEPHPDAPYPVIVTDAAEYLASDLSRYDAIHASPPCPRYSTITPEPEKHPDLIPWVRAALVQWGGPYVIENVPGARPHLRNPVTLCGSSFGLRVRRHRLFETNVPIWAPPACRHSEQGTPVGVYGDHPDRREHLRPGGTRRGAKARSLAEGREAMGIDWMTWDDLADAIPPAYTEFIGRQLLDHVQAVAS